MSIRIAGRRALVTGASGGLGGVIVDRLAAEGATVIATGRRVDALDALARATGVETIVADLAKTDDLTQLAGIAATIDVLVCNAALPATGPIDDFSVDQIDRALAVNLRAPLLLARAAATAMARRGTGHIVFISSMAAKMPAPSVGLYAATKAAIRSLGLCLREDLCGTGVGVSVVVPGPICDAGMWADAHITTPRGLRTKTPGAVVDAVVAAVEYDRAEIEVASPSLRAGALLAQLRPEWFATLGRRAGADECGAAMAAAARDKR